MKRKAEMKSQEAADYLGVSIKTLYRWLKSSRRIPHVIDPVSKHRYFRKEDLVAFLDGRIKR